MGDSDENYVKKYFDEMSKSEWPSMELVCWKDDDYCFPYLLLELYEELCGSVQKLYA